MTIDPEAFLSHTGLAGKHFGVLARPVAIFVALSLIATSGCNSSRYPPDGTPILHEVRVWMLGDPNSSRFVAIVSPWSFWRQHLTFIGGLESLKLTMLEQTAHVFVCDAATGSVQRLCEIRVPESVEGFSIEDEGVRFFVVGWDEQAAYVELRAHWDRASTYGELRPYSRLRIALDGTCSSQVELPAVLSYFHDIPDHTEPAHERYFPFPAAEPYFLEYKGNSIKLSYGGVWIVEFSIDSVTYDLRPVDLGPDSKRYLREAMDAAKKRRT